MVKYQSFWKKGDVFGVEIPTSVEYPKGETVFEPSYDGWQGECNFQRVMAPAARERKFADGRGGKVGTNRGSPRKKNA